VFFFFTESPRFLSGGDFEVWWHNRATVIGLQPWVVFDAVSGALL